MYDNNSAYNYPEKSNKQATSFDGETIKTNIIDIPLMVYRRISKIERKRIQKERVDDFYKIVLQTDPRQNN